VEPKKYEYIDSLRGLAILLVIVVHISTFFTRSTTDFFTEPLMRLVINGRYSIQLFFIVSAFTLMMSHERRRGEARATRNFFIRRFFRIAPLYYLAIIILTVFFIISDNPGYDLNYFTSMQYFSNYLFISSVTPEWMNTIVPGGWSVSVEVLFYLLFPILYNQVRDINKNVYYIGLSMIIGYIFFVFCCEYKAHNMIRNNFHILNLINHLPVFLMGMFAYKITKNEFSQIKYKTFLFVLFIIFLYTFIMPIGDFVLYNIIFMFLIIILQKYPYRLFSNKLFAKVGKVSFSMYIFHFFVISVFNKLNITYLFPINNLFASLLNFILLYLLVAICTYFISLLTFRFIETPGQNLGKKLIKKLDK